MTTDAATVDNPVQIEPLAFESLKGSISNRQNMSCTLHRLYVSNNPIVCTTESCTYRTVPGETRLQHKKSMPKMILIGKESGIISYRKIDQLKQCHSKPLFTTHRCTGITCSHPHHRNTWATSYQPLRFLPPNTPFSLFHSSCRWHKVSVSDLLLLVLLAAICLLEMNARLWKLSH